ncbi:MAG: hypothetical protein ACI8SE_002161 [Bacteroidia bacterium]|jgi:hypothetical protein
MKKLLTKILGLSILAFTLMQCTSNNSEYNSTPKFHPNDPFQETIVPSQNFEIDTKGDNVIEGKNGTIVVIPKECFMNSNGETVSGKVKIELAEALSLDQMLFSNLTTTANDKLLETDGMIYINASANGEQLTVDNNNPIYIEIPTTKRKSGMMAYKGVRDENGNMDWTDPKELEKILVTVDLNLLNFLPQGFEAEVIRGLPFKDHQIATKHLLDSLYYSLSLSNGNEVVEGFIGTDYNEPYYNKNKEVIDGKYTDKSYVTGETDEFTRIDSTATEQPLCGIDPAIIKVIKSEKFQNTLIATREFEIRLQTLFKVCRNDILEIYIKNLDKDLWEIDSIAASTLGEHILASEFRNYSGQKLTNVKEANKFTQLLQGYYDRQLKLVRASLESVKEKALKELQNKNDIAEKIATEYKGLLRKREKYRMETYRFEWSETGWINIDRGPNPKDWGPQRLEMIVQDGDSFDRVHTYVVYTSIKSLYRLNSSDNVLFYVGNDQKKKMLMPKRRLAVAISIAYRSDKPFLGLKQFETGTEQKLTLTLEQSSSEEIRAAIKPYDNYNAENRIDKDLKYMALFAHEKMRQEELKSESEFIQRLRETISPCCFTPLDGDLPDALPFQPRQ